MLLPSLVLAAVIAGPNAARPPTATVEVESPALARLDPRQRLGLDGAFGLGHFASSLTASFARWSISVGIDAPEVRPSSLLGPASDNGVLVAPLAHGLFLGHRRPPRAEIFPWRETLAATPVLCPGVQIGLESTLMLTPHLGLRVEARGGAVTFAGLSLIYRR